MLDDFLRSNRDAILERIRTRVASRKTPQPTEEELQSGIPVFLDQLGDALRLAKASDAVDHAQIHATAGRHGQDLRRMGLTIGQVVHDYGDVCQVLTELTIEKRAPIDGEEFRTLNLCLDDAIAGAVTEFARPPARPILEPTTERLGALGHDLRTVIDTATVAFEVMRMGRVAPGGSTGVLLARSLADMRELIDRSLVEVRLDAGMEHMGRVVVADFLREVEVGASIQAQTRGLHLAVGSVERAVTIEADWHILAGAMSCLLQNAFTCTPRLGQVSLTTLMTPDRVQFSVEDQGGGLSPGQAEERERLFETRGDDPSGVGLRLCHKAAKVHGGELRVRALPGKGCVFTLDLPRERPSP